MDLPSIERRPHFRGGDGDLDLCTPLGYLALQIGVEYQTMLHQLCNFDAVVYKQQLCAAMQTNAG